MSVAPKRRKPKTLPPIRANAGSEALYRRKLQELVKAMVKSVDYWVKASYKANEPVIAQDELPASVLKKVIAKLGARWQKKFDEAAPLLAEYFTKSANVRSARQLEKVLGEAGFTVRFKMTRAMRDVMKASVNEQVSLIKSIPEKYFTNIEGAVMRSVAAGRDLGPLAAQLQKQYGVTDRRAALIARDQNNKMTSLLAKTRYQELGINRAIWMHSGGGKEPRPKHVAFSGKEFDVSVGAPIGDNGEYVQPGEEINCRCVSRPVLPGLTI